MLALRWYHQEVSLSYKLEYEHADLRLVLMILSYNLTRTRTIRPASNVFIPHIAMFSDPLAHHGYARFIIEDDSAYTLRVQELFAWRKVVGVLADDHDGDAVPGREKKRKDKKRKEK